MLSLKITVVYGSPWKLYLALMADKQVTSAVTRVARYCMVGTLNLYGIMSKLLFFFFSTLAATMNRTPQRLESSCYLRYVNVLPKIPPKKEQCIYIYTW